MADPKNCFKSKGTVTTLWQTCISRVSISEACILLFFLWRMIQRLTKAGAWKSDDIKKVKEKGRKGKEKEGRDGSQVQMKA